MYIFLKIGFLGINLRNELVFTGKSVRQQTEFPVVITNDINLNSLS